MVAAGNIHTDGQQKMLRRLTTKTIKTNNDDLIDDNELANKAKTLRGKKYGFVKKIMKKCNSTDIADIMIYCKNTANTSTNETWNNIFRNTPNLQNITAAARGVNVETKVTLIWEQICQKKEFFNLDKNRYWSVQKSLNIFEELCNQHRIDVETFSNHSKYITKYAQK